MLSEKQEKFCMCVALYGMPPAMAAKEAGYKVRRNTEYIGIGKKLINNMWISSYINEMRDRFFDVDKMRREIILEHMQSRYFRVTDYVHSVADQTDEGVPYNRLVVKPFEEWDYIGKRMCIGFDRYGVPIFRSGVDATKELCKIFGFYKNNGVVAEEDTTSVLSNAGLTPSDDEEDVMYQQSVLFDDEAFDGAGFDQSLGVVGDSEETSEEDDDAEDAFKAMWGE